LYDVTRSLTLEDLAHPDPHHRALAIQAAAANADVALLERTMELADRDPDHPVRCTAISALGDWVAAKASPACDPETKKGSLCPGCCLSAPDQVCVYDLLLAIYRDEERSLDERRTAVEAMSGFTTEPVEALIVELYARPEKKAKLSALAAMGTNASSRWLPILRQEIGSPELDLQLVAIYSAGESGLDSLGRDLRRLTYAEDRRVMLAALWSLGQTGWAPAYDRLDELTLHPDPEIREAADEAMEEWSFYNGLSAPVEEEEVALEEVQSPEP